MNKNLELQIMKLQLALGYAKMIRDCDREIERNYQVDYFSRVRIESIEKYAEAVRDLIESFINISAAFEKQPDPLFEAIAKIIRQDAKTRLGINIL